MASMIWPMLWSFVLGAIAYDQYRYLSQKSTLPGPRFKIPFVGQFLESVHPRLHTYQAKWDSGSLSCSSVFHKFIVIASTRDMARKVFHAPTFVRPCLVDAAHKFLRPNNWVLLDGKAHADYRKGLRSLFTRNALKLYLPTLEKVQLGYFDAFVKITEQNNGAAVPFTPSFQKMMCAASCRTFVGKYMPDKALKRIAADFHNITAALELVNFPVIIPFTKTWYGKRCADMVFEEFCKCAAQARANMRAGNEPSCIMDQWISSMIASETYREKAEGKNATFPDQEKPDVLIRWFSDMEISMTIFTFLLASQDASSSACTWLFQLIADRPELLDKVHEESLRVRGGRYETPLSMDMVEAMTFTRAIVKETLRYRPPAIMFPYIAKKDYPITDTYTIPKGAMVCPSIYPAMHDPEAYPNPDTFDPDRWITGDAEKQTKNWLVFGTGAHDCMGQNYAILSLTVLLANASLRLRWKHRVTPESEEIKLTTTIYPKDDCLLAFEKRV